ncbi:MAG: AraC family transcriptional regulator [Bradyrhizobium sp.]|uniref:helix-turn-helix domain-containing protein n=1 Tax=Bradyrhizobium sp. TaxID=376 RepID=UPI001DEB3898|nr:helix-turn-helix domain-containing protein [Bradyrhizobium sp.]MBV9561123.1 AraC family transcriptional regulator [Bradyrhizobium sp.]
MPLDMIEIALRAAAVALLLNLAAALVRDARGALAGRLAIALALGSAAHAAIATMGLPLPGSGWHAPLIAVSTGNIVVFWLFCRALFDDGFVLRWRHGLIWAAVAAFSLLNCLLWVRLASVNMFMSGDLSAAFAIARATAMAVNLLVLIFIALAVGQTVASWSVDLVERRRRVRVFVVAATALYGGVNAILRIVLGERGVPGIADVVNAAILLGVVAAISGMMTKVAAAGLFSPTGVSPAVPVAPADQKLIDALTRLMADERIYRQDNVTIGMLATRLKIPEYRLRRLINQRLGYRNFNAFLNNHRIEEAKAALADPTQVDVPVITIAMDAGFQSLGPFNRAFKATTGITPTEYRKLRASAA